MASKKEHKRKQKSRGGQEQGRDARRSDAPRRQELNSLDFLSALHGIPKAAEGGRGEPGSGKSTGKEKDEKKDAAAGGEASGTPGKTNPVHEQSDADARERLEAERERQRLEAETAERAREEAERVAAEKLERLEAEKARQRLEAETAERARRMADAVERARKDAEDAERKHREAVEAERKRQEDAARERAREMIAAAERTRAMTEEVQRTRREAEERERRAALSRIPPIPPVPPLEVENPYWEKTPEIFEMLSGAPHAATQSYMDESGRDAAGSLPVTMAAGMNEGPTADAYGDGAPSDAPDQTRSKRGTTVPVPMEKRMYIVMVTPEVAPCAKVGGLGDVVLGLGRELMKRGHGVEVICPMYSGMRYDLIYDLHEEYGELWCPHYGEWRAEKVFQGKVEGGLQVNFITGGDYTERPNIYGYDDDLQRFTYFSRQALEFMYKSNRRPEIIHCHDWATGLVPPILWDVYEKLGWNNSRVVYTIHNNECQGLCGFPDKLLSLIGLEAKNYLTPDKMQDDTHRNCINMMKGGIVYSNFVTTVSPTYAGELKTVAGGRGLQNTIAKQSAKVGGVLNGIDYDSWNPQTDGKIAARYSGGDDFFAKYDNKKALRDWLGLWDSWKPIVSVVTRLTHQKGLDLIKRAIYAVQEMQGQFILLGSAPDPKVNAEFLRIQHEMRDNHDVNLYIGYHEDLSRLIYAGSDMFLVPSLYEPCGLTQMISLRYGTVPIVRETGGLVDTVFDLDNSGLGLNEANGFTFRDPTPLSLCYGLERAVRLWYDNPDAFNRLARNGMRYDYSWRHPAEHYENIYNYIKA